MEYRFTIEELLTLVNSVGTNKVNSYEAVCKAVQTKQAGALHHLRRSIATAIEPKK